MGRRLTALDEFRSILDGELIPEFCALSARGYIPAGYREPRTPLSDFDATHFLRGWRAGLMKSDGFGRYRASRNGSVEQFFWEGSRSVSPRPFWLWLEPVITLGAMARLHLDFGWPADGVAAQSSDYAFDVVAYRADDHTEAIAGEVKKTKKECDDLLSLMIQFGAQPSVPKSDTSVALNAYKKVAGLVKRRAPIFWLIGPEGYSRVFKVMYGKQDEITLIETEEAELQFRKDEYI